MTNEQIKNKVTIITSRLRSDIPLNSAPMSWNYVMEVLVPMLTELVVTEVRYQTISSNVADNLFLVKNGMILSLWYATYRSVSYEEFYDRVSERLYAHCHQFAREVRDEEFPIQWDEIFQREAKQ